MQRYRHPSFSVSDGSAAKMTSLPATFRILLSPAISLPRTSECSSATQSSGTLSKSVCPKEETKVEEVCGDTDGEVSEGEEARITR